MWTRTAHSLRTGRVHPSSLIYAPSSWWRWPRSTGTVGSGLHRWRCCRTPPPHRHRGTATEARQDGQRWRHNKSSQKKNEPRWMPTIIVTHRALTSPTSISKIRTPSPHQSTARVYDVSVKTSGAKNSGVPQNVLVRSLKPIPESNTDAVQFKRPTFC